MPRSDVRLPSRLFRRYPVSNCRAEQYCACPPFFAVDGCPLGDGMVDPKFFTTLRQSRYEGPISQHHDYEVGSGAAMIAALKKDLQVWKQWLAT